MAMRRYDITIFIPSRTYGQQSYSGPSRPAAFRPRRSGGMRWVHQRATGRESATCGRSHPRTMMARPDLPRWVNSARLDSAAMLSAFLRYREFCSEAAKEAVAELHSVEHAIRETISLGSLQVTPQQVQSPGPSAACTTPGCKRCATLPGGYQFR